MIIAAMTLEYRAVPDEIPPPPFDCHPAYADKPWIRDWVEGKLPQYNTFNLRIPVIQRPRLEMVEPSSSPDADFRVITMSRQKAWGPAPYVGDPFAYVWFVGTDNLGRHVCGDSEILYLPFEHQFY